MIRRFVLVTLGLLAVSFGTVTPASASVILPPNFKSNPLHQSRRSSRNNGRSLGHRIPAVVSRRSPPLAMAIPGYGVAEQVFVGGFANFLQLYNLVITARILLSWFPQAQGIGVLQPVFAITDPYLNLFRGIIPPVFGLDLSPLLAFFTLNVLTSTTASIGYEIPEDMQKKMKNSKFGQARTRGFLAMN